MTTFRQKICILGAGSWGTAVAIHLAEVGFKTMLWSHQPAHVERMQKEKTNTDFLPGISFPTKLTVTNQLTEAVKEADAVFIAVPSHAFQEILEQIPKPKMGLSWLTKGLDPKTYGFLSDLVLNQWGKDYPIAIISGPSFAKEVAQHLPTALTIASNSPSYQNFIRDLLHHQQMRVYLSDDIYGVQICGAVKNVLAIACGISDGLGFGANAKAAIITRGLAEMTRLGLKLGALSETFVGLAGLGDLVLTCTDNQSRNRRFGLLLGQGVGADEACMQIGQVVEGRQNAEQVCGLAKQHNISMPICEEVLNILKGTIPPKQAVLNLMNRPALELRR